MSLDETEQNYEDLTDEDEEDEEDYSPGIQYYPFKK